MPTETFGIRLWHARRKLGLSQRELASMLGVDYTYVSRLESDRTDYPPSLEIIEKLARHLDLDKEELCWLSGRILEEDQQVYLELYRQYKQFPQFLKRMRDNPSFAESVLALAGDILPR